jgi:hypothetical protein
MLSRFLRLTAACGVAALAVLASYTPAHAVNLWKPVKFQWNANGRTFDSLTATFADIAGTAGKCTTQAISTQDFEFLTNSTTSPATNQNYMKVAFTSDAAFAGDSLYYIMDYSVDGVNWNVARAHTGMAAVSSGQKVIAANVTIDSDAQPLAAGGGLWRVPLIRFRLSGDDGGVINSNVRMHINHPATHTPNGRPVADTFTRYQTVKWRFTSGSYASGTFDSLTVNFQGPSRACTTQAVNMEEWEPFGRTGSLAYTTAQPIANLMFTGTNTIDSISVAQDVSMDGINWTAGSAAYVQAAGTNTQTALITPINVDSDAGSDNPWRWRFIRWRITGELGVPSSQYKDLGVKVGYTSWKDPEE